MAPQKAPSVRELAARQRRLRERASLKLEASDIGVFLSPTRSRGSPLAEGAFCWVAAQPNSASAPFNAWLI